MGLIYSGLHDVITKGAEGDSPGFYGRGRMSFVRGPSPGERAQPPGAPRRVGPWALGAPSRTRALPGMEMQTEEDLKISMA